MNGDIMKVIDDFLCEIDQTALRFRREIRSRVDSAITVLRSSFYPPVDKEIEAIRKRHIEMQEIYGSDAICPMGQRDRAALLARHDQDQCSIHLYISKIEELEALLAAEQKRRIGVENTLKPFAAMAAEILKEAHPSWDPLEWYSAQPADVRVTYGDLRRAASLLGE